MLRSLTMRNISFFFRRNFGVHSLFRQKASMKRDFYFFFNNKVKDTQKHHQSLKCRGRIGSHFSGLPVPYSISSYHVIIYYRPRYSVCRQSLCCHYYYQPFVLQALSTLQYIRHPQRGLSANSLQKQKINHLFFGCILPNNVCVSLKFPLYTNSGYFLRFQDVWCRQT